jgi:hypothetical protein
MRIKFELLMLDVWKALEQPSKDQTIMWEAV